MPSGLGVAAPRSNQLMASSTSPRSPKTIPMNGTSAGSSFPASCKSIICFSIPRALISSPRAMYNSARELIENASAPVRASNCWIAASASSSSPSAVWVRQSTQVAKKSFGFSSSAVSRYGSAACCPSSWLSLCLDASTDWRLSRCGRNWILRPGMSLYPAISGLSGKAASAHRRARYKQQEYIGVLLH